MVTINLAKADAIYLSCILQWRIEDFEKDGIGIPAGHQDSKRIKGIIDEAIEKES